MLALCWCPGAALTAVKPRIGMPAPVLGAMVGFAGPSRWWGRCRLRVPAGLYLLATGPPGAASACYHGVAVVIGMVGHWQAALRAGPRSIPPGFLAIPEACSRSGPLASSWGRRSSPHHVRGVITGSTTRWREQPAPIR
jgi:hypothetical protein